MYKDKSTRKNRVVKVFGTSADAAEIDRLVREAKQWADEKENGLSIFENEGVKRVTCAAELKELFDKIGTTDGKELGLTIYQLQQTYKQTRTSYDYGEYIYDIQWYMALGYLKKNELGKARQQLSQIIQENYSNNPYLPRAIALYEEIHNLYFL